MCVGSEGSARVRTDFKDSYPFYMQEKATKHSRAFDVLMATIVLLLFQNFGLLAFLMINFLVLIRKVHILTERGYVRRILLF